MFEIKGFDEIDRKLAELQRRAEALGGERNVPYRELFTSTFMAKHTGFETLQAMWDASGLFVATESEEDCRKVLAGRPWNDFVNQRTQFSDWQKMLTKAGTEYAARQLFDGLGTR